MISRYQNVILLLILKEKLLIFALNIGYLMKKSYYILLTITAIMAVLFLMGNWVGRSFGLNKQQVTRNLHEAFCRATEAYEADTAKNLSALFSEELAKADLARIYFEMDTVSLLTGSVVLKQDLHYFSDYRKLIDSNYTFVHPISTTRGVHAHILNIRAAFIGKLLYYFFGTILALIVLLYSIRRQVNIIRRQDEMAQIREDFSYAMIHDMKNPISSILMGIKVLRSGKMDNKPEKKERYFDIMEAESQHLLTLANKVLTISKLEHGQLLLDKKSVQLCPMIEALVNTFTAKVDKPISFHLNLEVETVYADEEYLKEVLSNLIDNAVKYSKETVDIRISSCLYNEYAQIKVRDNGIGIPLSAQRSVFDKFERVMAQPNAGTKKVAGFGLGLNYVMNVTRAHGGYVGVESKEGKYSEFTVSLPPADEDIN